MISRLSFRSAGSFRFLFRLKWFSLLLIFIAPEIALTQSWKGQGNSTVTLRFGLVEPKLEMLVEDKNEIGKKITFVPNSPTRAFVGFSYKWLGGAISGALPRNDEENRIRGSTTSNDWQLRFNFQQWVVEALYQQYVGYYIENTRDFQAHTQGQPYLQAPDLSNERAGMTISYVTHPEAFSMSAAFDQSSQQMESGWSWIFSGSLNHHRFSTPVTLVPASETGTYGDFELVRAATLYSLLAGAGAGGTLVLAGPWFLSGVLILNFGLENQSVTRTDKQTANTVQTNEHHLKLGLGYNGDGALFGLGAHISGTNYNIENAKVGFSTTTAGFYVGTRIKF